jgi:hypothetical protein
MGDWEGLLRGSGMRIPNESGILRVRGPEGFNRRRRSPASSGAVRAAGPWLAGAILLLLATGSLPAAAAIDAEAHALPGPAVVPAAAGLAPTSSPASGHYAGFQVQWQWSPPGNPELWSVDFSPNGSLVAVASNRALNRSVFILRASNGSLLTSLDATDAAWAAKFSPNGSYLAVGGNNYGARVYETANFTQILQLQNGGDVSDLAWSRDSRYLSVAGPQAGGFEGRVSTFDATAGFTPVAPLSKNYGGRPALAVDWSYDSARLAVGMENVNGQDAFIYDRATGQQLREFNVFSDGRQVKYGPDPRYLAIGRAGQRFNLNDVDAWIWDTNQNYTGGNNPPRLSDYRTHDNGMAVNGLAYSPVGDAVATGGDNPNVDIWWSSNGTLAKRLGSAEARELRFDTAGARLAAAEFNPNRVTVWGDSTPPAVASVEISAPDRGGLPYYPDYLKAERAWFKVTFNEDVDPAFPPDVAFGKSQPYKAHKVNASGFTSPRVWEGWFNSSSAIENGEHRLQVAGARDAGGNVMWPDTNKTLWYDTREPAFSITPPASYWHSATSLNLSANASDADPANSSELAFVRPSIRWNNDLNASWSNWSSGVPVNLSGTSFQGVLPFSFSSGEGHYEFAFSVYDRAMNSPSTFATAVAGHDAAGPAYTANVVGSYWRNGTQVQIEYSVSDGVSHPGYSGRARSSSDNATWTPMNVSVGGWKPAKSYTGSWSISGLTDGHYQGAMTFNDTAGHVVGTGFALIAGVDSVPPVSTLTALPSITNKQVLMIGYTATDTLSGIARVQLEHRKDGGAWGACCPVSGSSGQFAFDTSLFGGDGLYEFRARAWDNASNGETVKPGNETWTEVDTVPPKLVSVFPTPGQVNVPATARPRVEISEPVTGTVKLMRASTPVDATVTWENGTTATITPTTALLGGVLYKIEISVQDRAGSTLTATSTFTTSDKPDTTSPRVSSTSPGPFSLVNVLGTVKIVFDEPMDSGTAGAASISPSAVDSPALSVDGKTLTFKVVPETIETTYTVTLSSAKAKDLAGNTLDGNGDGIGGDDHVFEFTYSASSPASLEVTVKDGASMPIASANVSLSRSGRTIGPVATDAGGQSVFSGLLPGEYTLYVTKTGYDSHTTTITLASGPNKQEVVLVRAGSQRGIDPLWLVVLAAVIIASFAFILLQRSRKCPRCGAQRDFGRKECGKCGYPKEMPSLFEGAKIAEARPREPAPAPAAGLEERTGDEKEENPAPAAAPAMPQKPKPTAKNVPPPPPPPSEDAMEKRESAAAKAAAKGAPAKGAERPFDPYKTQTFTATKSGISASDDVLEPESASEEERRKRAIEEAKKKAKEKEEFDE